MPTSEGDLRRLDLLEAGLKAANAEIEKLKNPGVEAPILGIGCRPVDPPKRVNVTSSGSPSTPAPEKK
jgi:hypothetical protein